MKERLFTIDNNTSILCEVYENSRNWGHRARVFRDGGEVVKTTQTYYNRTWESFQFQTVLRSALRKSCLYGEEEMDTIMKGFN
jgi:hypothetical protein